MVPDIKIKEFYLRYVFNAKRDIEKYEHILESIKNTKLELHNYISDYLEVFIDKYDIDLNTFESEWVRMKYNSSESLYKQILKLVKLVNDETKPILCQLIKYCYKLKEEYNTNKLIYIANKRKELSLKSYKAYVNKFYTAVHKAVLEGYGYKFNKGIGTFIINYYKINNNTKPKLDYAETNKRKRELIAKGLKPYDDKEAAWYKDRNIPYDGVEYRVFLNKNNIYDITFIESSIFHKKELDYQRTEYVHNKYRGLSYTEMADMCNNLDDIAKFNVDIKYKLNMYLHKYPDKYLNFVRNAECSKYKY